MIHVVFNESETDLLKQVMDLDESLRGEVVLVRDDFAVGPLANLDTEEGWQERVNWWREKLAGSPYPVSLAGSFDDRETVKQLKEKLAAGEQEEAWIWMAQNQHDVMGYYWLVPQLAEFQGRIMVLYLNNLPFINEKGQLFYPSWLSEIQPREFLKARKLARPVTPSEFEIDPDEWRRIASENAPIRILEGGKKIQGVDETYFDADILKHLPAEWQKATRALSHILHKMKTKTGDLIIMWRIRQLVQEGKVEVSGDVQGSWKEFDLRLPGSPAPGEQKSNPDSITSHS